MTLTLKDPSLLETRCLVAGEWVAADSGKVISVTDPATGAEVATVPSLSCAEVARAIAGAEAAQSPWAARAAKERANVLRRWFDLVIAATDDLGLILTSEQGMPLAEAKGEIATKTGQVQTSDSSFPICCSLVTILTSRPRNRQWARPSNPLSAGSDDRCATTRDFAFH